MIVIMLAIMGVCSYILIENLRQPITINLWVCEEMDLYLPARIVIMLRERGYTSVFLNEGWREVT